MRVTTDQVSMCYVCCKFHSNCFACVATSSRSANDTGLSHGVSSIRKGSRGAMASGLLNKTKPKASPKPVSSSSSSANALLPKKGVRTRLETDNKFYDIVVDGRVVYVISGFKVAKFTKPKYHEIQRGSGDSAKALATKLITEAQEKVCHRSCIFNALQTMYVGHNVTYRQSIVVDGRVVYVISGFKVAKLRSRNIMRFSVVQGTVRKPWQESLSLRPKKRYVLVLVCRP